MLEYVDEIIGSWDKACSELDDRYKAVSWCKRIATAAPDDLFKVDEDAMTRVKGPDIDDWRKLCHLVEYLRSMRGLPLILAAEGTGVLSWYFDTSFAVHPDMREHIGGTMTMGTGFPDKA